MINTRKHHNKTLEWSLPHLNRLVYRLAGDDTGGLNFRTRTGLKKACTYGDRGQLKTDNIGCVPVDKRLVEGAM